MVKYVVYPVNNCALVHLNLSRKIQESLNVFPDIFTIYEIILSFDKPIFYFYFYKTADIEILPITTFTITYRIINILKYVLKFIIKYTVKHP